MGRVLNVIFGGLLVCAAVFLFSQGTTIRKLRQENASLSEELRSAQETRTAQSAQPAQRDARMPSAEFSELLRLRSEVGQLRKLSNEVQTAKSDPRRRSDEIANSQPIASSVPEGPVQQEVHRQNAAFDRAWGMYNAGQISLRDLLQQKKQRFEYLTGVVGAEPGIAKREELVDRELLLDRGLVQQLQASAATNNPEMTELENEIRTFEAEKHGNDNLALPQATSK